MDSRRSWPRAFASTAPWIGISILSWLALGMALSLRLVPEMPPVVAAGSRTGDTSGVERAELSLPRLAIPDRMRRGDTLSTLLGRNGFSAAEVHAIAEAMSETFDARKLRVGDEFEIEYGVGGRGQSILIERGPLERYRIDRQPAGWRVQAVDAVVERELVSISGTLLDNLFLSMSRLGESAPLTIAFANVFAWDFDFYTQSRRGDSFSVVVEKLYHDGEFVGYGDLQAARYISGDRVFSAFLFEDPTGKRDYYNPEGKSMRKAFLRAPLEFERITSSFSYSRLHPVHHRRMPHLGVDYAARTGTPVFSVGRGVVTDAGRRGANGNMVTIKHAMGFTTKYLHLSRFAKGLKAGSHVEQRQVIGYVGQTGTATAPHLDFRLYRHGKPVNPVTQIFPPGPPVDEAYREAFDALQERLAREMDRPHQRALVNVDDD